MLAIKNTLKYVKMLYFDNDIFLLNFSFLGVHMGRTTKNIPTELLRSSIACGKTQKVMAQEFGVSIPTIARRMAKLRAMDGSLRQYKKVQNLRLTELQVSILEAISSERLENASLRSLAKAYKTLGTNKWTMDFKPYKVSGLLGYLLEIEAQQHNSE